MTRELVREGLTEQITRLIREQIESGRLRHGQALPSTRQLAKDYEVSPKTINAALGPLIDEGLVVSRDRAGRTVNAPDQTETPAVLKLSRPQVVLVGGYPGSGKSEFGRMVVRETGWGLFDKDTTSGRVVEAALEALGQNDSDRESDVYLNIIRPAEYRALMEVMTENIQCGASVVLSAPFIRELNDPEWIAKTKASCDEYGANLNVVWVTCDYDSRRGYMRHRGARRDDWKLANWEAYLESITPEIEPSIDYMHVENSGSSKQKLRDQARELVSALIGESQ